MVSIDENPFSFADLFDRRSWAVRGKYQDAVVRIEMRPFPFPTVRIDIDPMRKAVP